MRRLVWSIVAAGLLAATACRGSRGGSLSDADVTGVATTDANPFPVVDGGGAGYALSFDGIRDYATAANAGFPAATAAQSIELWMKVASVPATGNQDLFVARQDFSNGAHLGFHGGALAVWRVYVDRVLVQAPALPAPNVWHHVAYTYDGTTHILYVDGAAVDSQTNPADERTPTSVWLGTVDGSHELFAGLMDEVRVWSAARTAAQVAGDKLHTAPGPVADLVAYWTFDDVGSGGRALDASGNGNTVTLGDGVAAAMPSRVVSDAPVAP